MNHLTERQKLFAKEYLIDLNAEAAAIRAGYSPKYARGNAHKLVANSCILNEIEKAMADRSKRIGVNQDRVVLELAKIAFVKMTDAINPETGEIKEDAADDDLACIESIKYKKSVGDTGTSIEREVKISPKLKALELLGKHLGMWNDKLDVNITQPIVISGEEDLAD